MGKLRISDHLFAFLMNFKEELGKNNDEIRLLTDAVAQRIYDETKLEMDKKIKEGLIDDPVFDKGYVLGAFHAYYIFRQKDFHPQR